MKEEKKTNKITEWINCHPKTFFTIRFILWVLAAAILPFSFIAWRYEIFTTETKVKLTGWGFIAVIIVLIFVVTLIKYIYKSLKPGLAKQCIFGFTGIIVPLIILYLLIVNIEDSIDLFKQALGCVILCEAVAIPINPFPSWIAKKQEENLNEKINNVSDIFLDKFFSRKKGKDK